MLNVPKTYFGDPVEVSLEEGCDTPLLCLDFSQAINSDIDDGLINFDLNQGYLLALQILKAVSRIKSGSQSKPQQLDIAS